MQAVAVTGIERALPRRRPIFRYSYPKISKLTHMLYKM